MTEQHIWRIIAEPHLARDVWYILIMGIAAALSLGAGRVLWRARDGT